MTEGNLPETKHSTYKNLWETLRSSDYAKHHLWVTWPCSATKTMITKTLIEIMDGIEDINLGKWKEDEDFSRNCWNSLRLNYGGEVTAQLPNSNIGNIMDEVEKSVNGYAKLEQGREWEVEQESKLRSTQSNDRHRSEKEMEEWVWAKVYIEGLSASSVTESYKLADDSLFEFRKRFRKE